MAVIIADALIAQIFHLPFGDQRIAGAAFLVILHMMAEDHRAGCAALDFTGHDGIQDALRWKDDQVNPVNLLRVIEHQAVEGVKTGRDETIKNGTERGGKLSHTAALVKGTHVEKTV